MSKLQNFIRDLSYLDVAYVYDDSDVFNEKITLVCETYNIDKEVLEDSLEQRYENAVTLLRERLVPDNEEPNIEDELPDIPWNDGEY